MAQGFRYLDATHDELVGRSLYRFIARLRCKGCGAIGDIPEIRLTSSDTRFGHFGNSAPAPAGGWQTNATTHPSRSRRRRKNWWLWVWCPACGGHYAPHALVPKFTSASPASR